MQPAGPSFDYAIPHHELDHDALVRRYNHVRRRQYIALTQLDNLWLLAFATTDGAEWCQLAYREVPAAEELERNQPEQQESEHPPPELPPPGPTPPAAEAPPKLGTP